VNSLKNKFDKA
jgi:hypothetical protein